MKTDIIDDLHIGLIGHPVEIGIYKKETGDWVGTTAGLLTTYTATPEKHAVTIAQSNSESSESFWDPETHEIHITVIK